MRGRLECSTALAACSTSSATARAKDAMMGPSISLAMLVTASKSPGELAAKPASMMSTCIFCNWRAISIFSTPVMPMPADCSPSRRVVSKSNTRSLAIIVTYTLSDF